jgi:hypothetical protein
VTAGWKIKWQGGRSNKPKLGRVEAVDDLLVGPEDNCPRRDYLHLFGVRVGREEVESEAQLLRVGEDFREDVLAVVGGLEFDE